MRFTASLLALLVAPALARAEVPVLVELFTSEGCSSCPPADSLLARLAAERTPGVRIVALSEHVDYWNDLGWRDPFSSPEFTRRQREYARRLGRSGLYTPQLVVAGRIDVLGSDERAARAAIASAARDASGRVDARVAPASAGELAVVVEARWASGVAADVLVALVRDRATTRVERGENAGRTLDHVAIVRSITQAGSGAGTFSGRATLPRDEALDGAHLVVFVQERGGGPVHAVTTVELRGAGLRSR